MDRPDGRLKLYLENRAALVEYAKPLVGCAARAEDVVQDAWIKFAPAARETEIAHPLAYLYRTVRNCALDLRRKLAVENRRLAPSGLTDALVAPAPSPEQEVGDRERLRIVADALAELPPRTREVFDLYRFQGLTFPQVAARMGISVGLAHQLVHAALSHCADRLEVSERSP